MSPLLFKNDNRALPDGKTLLKRAIWSPGAKLNGQCESQAGWTPQDIALLSRPISRVVIFMRDPSEIVLQNAMRLSALLKKSDISWASIDARKPPIEREKRSLVMFADCDRRCTLPVP